VAVPFQPDRQHLGSVGPADRAMAMHTPDGMHDRRRHPVTYDPAGTWIALAIILILSIVFFGFLLA